MKVETTTQIQSLQPPATPQKKTNLPIVLIILGIFKLLFAVLFGFFVLIRLQSLYSSEGFVYNPLLSYVLLGIAILIAITEIGVGVFFIVKQKIAPLTKNYKRTSIVLLIGGLIFFCIVTAFLVLSVILPMYVTLVK